MQNDVCRLMFLAIACNLPCNEAYDILQQSYIDDFTREYDAIPASGDKPTVLDAMISFTMRELPIRTGVEGSVTFSLRSRRSEIVNMFIEHSLSEMITSLASREVILDMIRGYLRRENTRPGMFTKINSSRVNEVFSKFLAMFETNCAHAFQFEGSFKDFVMNCFIQFFYKAHKRDIWAMIKEVDTARREVEQSIVQEKILSSRRTDDVPIHDLVLNISLVNDMIFTHSGQSDDARGVQYDIYYLLLCELCSAKVQEINKALGDEVLVFVDPYDRKEARLGLPANKGIAAKVSNAKELIPPVFDYVRDGKFNIANLADLRDRCFKLGKHDREGRNCVWSDVVAGGETSRYLDTTMAAKNYKVFDLVVKGVVSAFTLMTEIESRGQYLVDSYIPDLFRDKDIVRYIDYLSSVPYIDLIRKLQQEPVDYSKYGTDLLEFPQMVDEYAGSSGNNHPNIRENRYYAITHGFMYKPRLKQSSVLVTKFDQLRVLTSALDAIPRSCRDYVKSLNPNEAAQYKHSKYIAIPAGDVVGEKYDSLYTNIFVASRPEAAEYYLCGNNGNVRELLDTLGWNVGTSSYEAVLFSNVYGVFLPLHRKFFFYGDEETQPFLASWEEVVQVVYDRRGSRFSFALLDQQIAPVGHMEKYANRLQGSMGFSYEVGISNIGRSEVQSRIDKLGVTPFHAKYLTNYYTWLDDNARLQHSIIDVLRILFTESLYMLYEGSVNSQLFTEYQYAQATMEGLLTGEFNDDALSYFLEKIRLTPGVETMEMSDVDARYRAVDLTVLDYVYGDITEETRGAYIDAVHTASQMKTPASKFLALYNLVYSKLEFLRYLRDAYSLLIDCTPMETSTLVSELTQRFGIDTCLREYSEYEITFGARTEQMSYEAVKQDIWETRTRCVSTFRTLVTELIEYVKDCESEIAKLAIYGITAQNNVRSRFSEFGKAFAILPAYPAIPELAELRRKAVTDSAGFFLLNGQYFRGQSGGHNYYVHRSGRMLVEEGHQLVIAEFDFSKVDDAKKYESVLRSGLG